MSNGKAGHQARPTNDTPATTLASGVSTPGTNTATSQNTPFNRPGDKVSGTITGIGVGHYHGKRVAAITVTNSSRSTTLYFVGTMRHALTAAFKKAGVDRPEIGGRLWACYVRTGPVPPGCESPQKFIAAKYTPPGAAPSRARRLKGDRTGGSR